MSGLLNTLVSVETGYRRAKLEALIQTTRRDKTTKSRLTKSQTGAH